MNGVVFEGEIDTSRPCAMHPDRRGTWYDNDTYLCYECKAKMAVISNVKPTVVHLGVDDRRRIGMLVQHAINHLWYSSPDAAPDGYVPVDGISRYMGCCPRCCGPCAALHELVENNQLDAWVLGWPEMCTGMSWWDADFQMVDRAWLRRTWASADRLGCHT